MITDSSSAADSGGAVYLAFGWSGGSFVHVDIYKRDDTRNLCFKLFLAGEDLGASGLTLPKGWGVLGADVAQQAAGCGAPGVSGSPHGNHTGTVTFSGTSFIPSSVSLNVVLNVGSFSEPLEATDLAIMPR